jgi:hypothetical protein
MKDPDNSPHFPALQPLKERLLKIHERGHHPETVESTLAELVDSLEKAHYRLRFKVFVGENYDDHADMKNLHNVRRELEAIGERLEKACKIRNSFFRW